MRVVVASDLHLHNYREFASFHSQSGVNSRLSHGLNVLRQIRKYCSDNNITHFIFLGDLVEKGNLITPDILFWFVEILREFRDCNVKCCFLVGNHDQQNISGLFDAVTPFDDYAKVIKDVDNWYIEGLELKDVHVCGVAARRTMKEQLALLEKTSGVIPDMVNVFIGHFYCRELLIADGIPDDQFEAVPFSALPTGYDYYFLGDYHRPVRVDSLKLESLGAVQHHNFGDVNRPQGQFLDIDLTHGDRIYVPVESPKFVDVPLGAKFPKDYDLNNFHRVHVKSEKERDKILSKLKGDWNIRFVFEGEPEVDHAVRMDVNPSMAPIEVISRYVGHVEADKRLIDMGKQYFQRVGV